MTYQAQGVSKRSVVGFGGVRCSQTWVVRILVHDLRAQNSAHGSLSARSAKV